MVPEPHAQSSVKHPVVVSFGELMHADARSILHFMRPVGFIVDFGL